MMRLSLMKEIFETVDSEYNCTLAEELLQPWNYDKNSVKLYRASANFICIFENDDKNYVLRFNKDTERDIRDLTEEVNFLNYLHSENIHIAKPVLSKNVTTQL